MYLYSPFGASKYCHGHGTYQIVSVPTLNHVFVSFNDFHFVLPVLARVSFCVVVPVLPFISILSAEKHDRIKWRSRQDGRNSTHWRTEGGGGGGGGGGWGGCNPPFPPITQYAKCGISKFN